MSVLHYFNKIEKTGSYQERQFGNILIEPDDNLKNVDVVFFDIEEERGSVDNKGCSKGGIEVRKYLYQLFQGNNKIRLADLGTIKAGDSITDTYFALKESIAYFIKNDIIPVFLGGSQDLVYANYLAYIEQEQLVNLVSIDARFGFGDTDERITSQNYLGKIILHQPNVLFNYGNLGYQTYLIDQNELKLLEEMFFDSNRLGEIKEDIRIAEPIIRNADFINFSLSAIAQPYASANKNSSPNGLNGEQACQLSRYAGMSDKLTSFGIYDFNPSIADNGQSAHLIAQMIWYFIDGFYSRKRDFPKCNKQEYVKYTVAVDDGDTELIFYKSPKSDRWWMEVPYNFGFRKKYERHLLLPCNYKDYQIATSNEIPEKWFQTFKKLK